MEIFKDQAAIDYLSRAQSCLHPEVDNFGGIPLLSRLISLESAFLSRLVNKGLIGLPLPMGDHGLPELSAWNIDIIKAFEEVGMIRANRAQSLAPVLQEVVNASARGVDKKFEELERTMSSDSELLRALEGFTQDEEDFLTQKWNNSSSFPFCTVDYARGLLLSRSDRSPFSEKRGRKKRFNGQRFRPGFKYVDAGKESSREPMFIMVAFSTEHQGLGFRLITKREPLLQRSELKRQPLGNLFYNRHNNSTDVEYYDLWVNDAPAENSKINRLERDLRSLRPAIFRALYGADFTGKPSELEVYLESLFKLNNLANEAEEFSQKVLGLKPMTAKELSETRARFSSELSSVYNTIEDDRLRRVLQLAMAEEMNKTRKITEAAEIIPDSKRSLLSRLNIFQRR